MAKLPYKQMMNDTAQVRHLRSDPFYRNLLRDYPVVHLTISIPMAARRCLSTFPVRTAPFRALLVLGSGYASRGHASFNEGALPLNYWPAASYPAGTRTRISPSWSCPELNRGLT